jgi:hypothetical protein
MCLLLLETGLETLNILIEVKVFFRFFLQKLRDDDCFYIRKLSLLMEKDERL